jgi:hypothetical protein
VNSYVEVTFEGYGARLMGPGRVDDERSTGHDTCLMTLDDTVVDALRQSKIIGDNDKFLFSRSHR